MGKEDIAEILGEVQKTNSHINEIYTRIDGLKDNQFTLQQAMFELSQNIQQNQLNDFKSNVKIQEQIKNVARKHGSRSGKKWGSIGSILAAAIAVSFKIYEKFSNQG